MIDETEIADHLARLSLAARALFACTCAERLMANLRTAAQADGETFLGFVKP